MIFRLVFLPTLLLCLSGSPLPTRIYASELQPSGGANTEWPKTLTPRERDRLRFRLETLFNEQDLLIRNQRVDHSDVERQKREFNALKVFERIPLSEDVRGLRQGLGESAARRGVRLTRFRPLPRPRKRTGKIPALMYTDQRPPFRFTDAQLVDEIPFQVVVEGEKAAVLGWIEGWADDQMRLSEPTGGSAAKAARPVLGRSGLSKWRVKGHAFRFRDVTFPRLIARNSSDLLPPWAARDPDRFAHEEPLLWSFVTRTRAIAPQAAPLYRDREQFMLNAARMSFYLSKTMPSGAPSHPHGGHSR